MPDDFDFEEQINEKVYERYYLPSDPLDHEENETGFCPVCKNDVFLNQRNYTMLTIYEIDDNVGSNTTTIFYHKECWKKQRYVQ